MFISRFRQNGKDRDKRVYRASAISFIRSLPTYYIELAPYKGMAEYETEEESKEGWR